MSRHKTIAIAERARRERAMMEFRSWIETNGISRREAADYLGITVGHLSTLLNANRTPSQDQVDAAFRVMRSSEPHEGLMLATDPSNVRKSNRASSSRKTKKRDDLRPLNQFEANFVSEVAQAWIKSNPDATQEQLVDVVRALSLGIRA